MPNTANKIKYGIKNVHYAIATTDINGVVTYGTPHALPGAVSLSLDAQGDNTKFYADNIVYWVGNGNSGYEGDLELAYIPDSFRKDVLEEIEDSNGVLVEDMNAPIVHFALLFQFEGDQKAIRHVLYNCTCSRPSLAGNTKEENIDPQTESLTISATSAKLFATDDREYVKARTSLDAVTNVYEDWFESVYIPTAPTVVTT